MNTSWTTATMAPTAMRHSKRIEMYSAMTTKKKMRARIAFFVISLPHVGLTELTLTSSGCTPALAARSLRTLVWTSDAWAPTWMRMRSPPAPDSVWILASAVSMPFAARTSRTVWVVTPLDAGISQATPPSKSMPRFSPRVNSDTMRQQDEHAGDDEADAALADEVVRGLAVVEPVPDAAPWTAGAA